MSEPDHSVLDQAAGWVKNGRKVALATVIETWGSAPQPVGSQLAIDADGNFIGSVSGGCVEGEVVTQALDVIGSGKPKVLAFGVADRIAVINDGQLLAVGTPDEVKRSAEKLVQQFLHAGFDKDKLSKHNSNHPAPA